MDIQEYKTSINHYTVPVIWMQNRDSKKKKTTPKKRYQNKTWESKHNPHAKLALKLFHVWRQDIFCALPKAWNKTKLFLKWVKTHAQNNKGL